LHGTSLQHGCDASHDCPYAEQLPGVLPQVPCDAPGSCSQYGQACDATHTCCNDVPCNNGYCVQILQ
jgi:hypothetical protein